MSQDLGTDTDTDAALAQALADDDRQRYFQVIVDAVLYLPAFTAGRDETAGQRFVTWDVLGRTYLPVFTSVEALTAAVGGAADAYTVTGYDELRRKWPDPELRLALNPGQPIDAWVDIDAVEWAAAGTHPVQTVADLVPEPPDGVLGRYLRALLAAEVLVPTVRPGADPASLADGDFPWRLAEPDPPTIDVFTSVEAMVSGTPWVPAPFVAVVLAWPTGHRLRLDPGSAVAFTLEAEDVPGLLLWRESA